MDTNERKAEAAEELQAEIGQHQAGRIEAEQDQQEDLNQGMQTGTHDALHPGIKWGSSYRVKKSAGKPETKS